MNARIIKESMSFTLEERKIIYSWPIENQFIEVFVDGKARVLKHLIKQVQSEDYGRVLDVAKSFALLNQSVVYILPDINRHEVIFRKKIGLPEGSSTSPDLMLRTGYFIEVKSPISIDTITANACKACRQFAMACLTGHRLKLRKEKVDQYAKWIFKSRSYRYRNVFFWIDGVLYKRSKD